LRQRSACIHAGLTCLGNCRFDYSGCTAESQAAVQRFVDNGNGTATDRLTGLVWELKCTATRLSGEPRRGRQAALAGRRHHMGERAQQRAVRRAQRLALTLVGGAANAAGRVPPCATPPCPVAAWPRDGTAPAGYWSSTSLSLDRQRAWAISFGDGEAYTAAKDTTLYVRAVRGGS